MPCLCSLLVACEASVEGAALPAEKEVELLAAAAAALPGALLARRGGEEGKREGGRGGARDDYAPIPTSSHTASHTLLTSLTALHAYSLSFTAQLRG